MAETKSSTMKFSSSVVTTSSTDSLVFSHAGTSSSKAPAAIAATIISTYSRLSGRPNPSPPCSPPTATAASAPA
jgi:hypothetical protein